MPFDVRNALVLASEPAGDNNTARAEFALAEKYWKKQIRILPSIERSEKGVGGPARSEEAAEGGVPKPSGRWARR